MRTLDRLLGCVLVTIAVGIGFAAGTFNVGFLVDPLGPKALPYLVAGLFVVGGSVILLFPDKREGSDKGRPSGAEEVGGTEIPREAWRFQTVSILILLGYASALPVLGFVLSTSLATGALSRVFSGRFLSGFGVGMAFGLGLFGLFTLGFGMELPVGALLGGDL